jgi:hypothetical protein
MDILGVVQLLAPLLELHSLLEVVKISRGGRCSVCESLLWKAAHREVPGVVFRPEHFQPSIRKEAVSIVASLAEVCPVHMGTLILDAQEDVRRFKNKLRLARGQAVAHVADNGGAAEVLLASLLFPTTLREVLCSTSDNPGLCHAEPVVVKLEADRSGLSGMLVGAETFTVHFAVRGGPGPTLMISVRDDDLPASEIEDEVLAIHDVLWEVHSVLV